MDLGNRAAVVVMACAALACSGDQRQRVLPEVEAVDGVEVARLEDMPPALDEAYQWELNPVRTILSQPTVDASPLFFDPRTALPLGAGRLLVHDPYADQPLVVLDDAGRVENRFGQNGEGPGELSPWVTLIRGDQGRIHVLDWGNIQLHTFEPAGQHLSSQRIEAEGYFRKSLPRPGGGSYLTEVIRPSSSGMAHELRQVDLDTGGVTSFIPLPDRPRQAGPNQIQPGRPLWTVLREGVVTMRSEQPVLDVYDPAGELVRQVQLPLGRRMLTEADIRAQVEHYGSIAESLEPGLVALTNELFSVNDSVFGMLLSALWRVDGDPAFPVGEMRWRMFTLQGEYVGVVQVPDDFLMLASEEGSIWARTLDENGLPMVQKFELVRAQEEA